MEVEFGFFLLRLMFGSILVNIFSALKCERFGD